MMYIAKCLPQLRHNPYRMRSNDLAMAAVTPLSSQTTGYLRLSIAFCDCLKRSGGICMFSGSAASTGEW